MSQDAKVIGYISQSELVALMRATGMISVQETENAGGKPVIHALLKVINAQTGAELPGGLPFSVVMFKRAADAGYSNIAIGTVVPAAELGIALPADFFNLCNQRFRFIRAFPVDATSFVLQMDLIVSNATGEYVKFAFGLWAAMFSQVLFELMGSGRDAVSRAAEIYARTPAAVVLPAVDSITSEPAAEEQPTVESALPEPEGECVPASAAAEPAMTEAAVTGEAPAAPEVTPAAEAKPAAEPPAGEPEVKAEAKADAAETKIEEPAPAEKIAEPAAA